MPFASEPFCIVSLVHKLEIVAKRHRLEAHEPVVVVVFQLRSINIEVIPLVCFAKAAVERRRFEIPEFMTVAFVLDVGSYFLKV